MIYNSNKEIDVQNAITRLKWLVSNKKIFEIKQKREKRSIAQNSYLHLILSWFGLQTGYTLQEVKQEIFKKHVNPELFYEGDKNGVVTIQKWLSTSDLNTQEMTLAIDKFRDFASKEAGIYLPEPKDLAMLQDIEIEISKQSSKQYL